VTDDDLPGATVEPTSLSIAEGQGGKIYTVKLATEPAGSVYVTAVSDNSDVRVSPASFTLTSGNWRQGRTVTVSAVHDDVNDDAATTITHTIDAQRTSADEYDGVSVGSVSVIVDDDDAPGVRVSPERLRIAEGRSGSYNVHLHGAVRRRNYHREQRQRGRYRVAGVADLHGRKLELGSAGHRQRGSGSRRGGGHGRTEPHDWQRRPRLPGQKQRLG